MIGDLERERVAEVRRQSFSAEAEDALQSAQEKNDSEVERRATADRKARELRRTAAAVHLQSVL